MDFTWVSNIPDNRKVTSLTNNSSNVSINNNELNERPLSRNSSRLSLQPLSNSSNNETARRSRAGTMPTSSISPFTGLGPYITQQRPNQTPSDSFTAYPHSGMSSPLDENTTNSIASTLASLGLNDDEHDNLTSNKSTTPASNSQNSYFDTMTRHRAFTVSSRNFHNDSVLPFPSFPQHQKITGRPRAISLGMVDASASTHQEHTDFFPFDSNTIQPSSSTSSNLINDKIPLMYQPHLFKDSNDDLAYQHDLENMSSSRLPSPNNLEPPAQIPSRALWLGNITPSLSIPDLYKMFSRYGKVESARILSDKECAFVNFETVESALAARDDLVNRLGCKVGGSVVKVGFGKADVDLAMAMTQDAGPNAQGPTRSIWVGNIPANINPTVLRGVFQVFGPIESIRILSHKNCGFINFERQEDAVRARKHMQNKEILGPGTGTVRVGFARDPTYNPDEVIQDVVISGNTITSYATPSQMELKPTPSTSSPLTSKKGQQEKSDTTNTTQWATVIMMASMMMNAQQKQQQQSENDSTLSNTDRLAAEREFIMKQLGYVAKSDEEHRTPINYCSSIPPVPEFNSDRILGPLRLREIKKSLDNGQGIPDIESIAQECMNEIIELCSDYIGNTVVQKLFEHCCEATKLKMITKIAPYLASTGVHKNGTWAAQRIIDTARTDEQIKLICSSVAPYVPLLLLDQYGNYVVQCCLRMGPAYNQYIFDAIVEKCWEIGQGRFGARAVRAILENPIVTKNQQIYVASAIMQNALLLSTNANGSILLNWLLDTSGLLGHYQALCNVN